MTSQNNAPASLCDAARDLIPAYAAGMADADERALVERGLVECPDAANDLAAHNRLTEGMLFSTPPVTAPAHLRAKILQAASAAPASKPSAQPVALFQRWLDGFFRPSLQLRPVLVVAVVALFILTNIYWWQQVQQKETIAIQTSLLNFAGTEAGATTHVNLQAQPDAPEASLVYSKSELQNSWVGMFSVRNLPALEEGTYQGWLMRGDEAPLSIGLFNVDESGTGWLIFEIGEPIGSYERLGVTAEPAGGSPGPTSAPVLAGQL